MKPYASLMAGSALVLLSACAAGPDYVPPAPPASTHYDAAAESRPGIAFGEKPAGDWWRVFRSDKLDGVMRQAIAGNLDLAAADATIAQAAEAVASARGGLYPQVDYGSGLGRQRLASPPQAGASNFYAIGAQVSFDPDVFGGTHRVIEQREAFAEFQRRRFDAARLTLTGDVATQAILLASARAQIEAVQALLADDRKTLDLVRIAHQTGSLTQVDLVLAESQIAQDETLLPPLAQQRDAARHALSILAGAGPADWVAPDFDLADFSLPAKLPVSLPAELAHDRPDILQAEAELHAASAAVGIATANLYPRLTLSASFTQAASDPGALFEPGGVFWGIAAGLTGPIFHGGALQADRRGAEDAYTASLARYRQTVIRSFGQVADVLQAIDHHAEERAAQERALASADISLHLSRDGYRGGEAGILRVLDAQRAYERALLGQIKVRTAQYLDTTQLLVALGGNSAGAAQLTASTGDQSE